MKSTNKTTKAIAVILAGTILLTSCASSTMIQSIPTEAKLYIDGEYKGETPYKHEDTKIVFSSTDVKLTKEGYKDYLATFKRDEEIDAVPIIVGLFFLWPVWLWALKYDPARTYELEPIDNFPKSNIETPILNVEPSTKSKADQLRELKQLLDEGILTKEEYEKEKNKILEEK